MKLCMIPARGGSKRIPGKNIRPFHGTPMLARSVATAVESGVFDRIVVSTDSDAIAEVARRAGAEVPFMRPAHLSDDHATTLDVIAHTLDVIEGVSALLCLYATAPFVRGADLRDSHALWTRTEADYVFAATEFPFPVQRGFTLGADGSVEMLQPEHTATRSQDLPDAYHDAGQFYWCRPEAVREGRAILGPGARAHIIPRTRAQDIDTPEDWEFAEALFAVLESRGA